jgi:hypothetical protein
MRSKYKLVVNSMTEKNKIEARYGAEASLEEQQQEACR